VSTTELMNFDDLKMSKKENIPTKNERVTAGPAVLDATSPANTYMPRPKVLPIPENTNTYKYLICYD